MFVTEAIVAAIIDRTTTVLHHVGIPDITLTLIGTAISVVLAFRVQAAYARWWEARILWGNIVNSSRSLARQVLSIAERSPQASLFARHVVELQIAWVRIFCAQLSERDTNTLVKSTFRDIVSPVIEFQENRAVFVMTEVGVHTQRASQNGLIDSITAGRIDSTLTDITNAQGGCERIKNTPLPPQLAVLSDTFVYLYALLLPFALADSLGIILPVVTGVITFTFLALSNVGKNLEHPFAGRFYDISILTITNGIENVLRGELAAVLNIDFDSAESKIEPRLEVAVPS